MNLQEFPFNFNIWLFHLVSPHPILPIKWEGFNTVISPAEYFTTNQLATSCVAFEDWEQVKYPAQK